MVTLCTPSSCRDGEPNVGLAVRTGCQSISLLHLQIGVDDRLQPWFKDMKLHSGRELLKDCSAPLCRSFLRCVSHGGGHWPWGEVQYIPFLLAISVPCPLASLYSTQL